MAENMYTVAGDCPDNEELACRLQAGDDLAAEFLLSQNEGFLTATATALCRGHSRSAILEDLKQEGAIALLEAARSFEPQRGVRFLTYTAPAVEAAMRDYAARNTLSVSLPTSRYNQLRKVAKLRAANDTDSESMLILKIQTELSVSEKVARSLLLEYLTLFHDIELDANEFRISFGGDPAKAYDRRMRRILLHRLMDDVLSPRERNLVRYHLGFDQPKEQPMTFQELAIFLNYNGPSGAEKAYKRAVQKIRDNLHSGEYGVWVSVQEALRRAVREPQHDHIYIPPQRSWTDQ